MGNPKEDNEPATLQLVESCFFLAFAVELLLRVCALGRKFVLGPQRAWNFFDAIVVLTAGIEEIIKLTSNNNLRGTDLTFLRVMRLVKITRAMRIIRIVRIFRELRIMVLSILSTVRTLFWAM